ncbi:superkiller complex protein 8 [Pelodytes ibericus]
MGRLKCTAKDRDTPGPKARQLSSSLREYFATPALLARAPDEASNSDSRGCPGEMSKPLYPTPTQLLAASKKILFQSLTTKADFSNFISEVRQSIREELAQTREAVTQLVRRIEVLELDVPRLNQASGSARQALNTHTHALRDMRGLLEDLDNRGRCLNIRVRGIPEGEEPNAIKPLLTKLFNQILGHASDTPIELDRAHRVNGTLSRPISIPNGTRQGCRLSPLLFALSLEPFLEAIRQNVNIHGLVMGEYHHKVAAYADDLLFIVTKPDETLPEIMREFRRLQYSILFKQEQAHDDAIWSVGWGKNVNDGSEMVISGSLDDLVKVWKWADERLELQWTLEGHQLGVVSVDVSPSGNILASSSLDAHIRLWDLESGKQIRSIDAGPVDAWSVAFSPDSQHLATGSHVGKVNIFGVETGKKEFSLDTRGKFILSIAYSPDGKYLASGAIDGIINIFDIATGKLLHTLEGHAMPIRSLTFSPDSQLLVTASDDGYIKIYDVQHASLAATLSGHGSWVLNVAFSPDDAHFVSSSSDKSVKVWDVATRTCVHTFLDHQDQVWGVQYNRNGSKIVSVGDDQEIHIYDCPI